MKDDPTQPELPPQPELAPGTAVKVLTASLRNVVNTVAEGGVLSSAHHRTVQGFALTPESARHSRGVSLLMRWASGGRLNDEEIADVRVVFPDFNPDGSTAALPLAAAQALQQSAPVRAGRLTADQLKRWHEIYDTEPRQLRRWHLKGVEKNDACPFDHPTQMPAWWGRNMKHVVPPKILAAAAKARESEGDDGQPSPEKTQSAGAEAPPAGVPPAPPAAGGFDLNASGFTEGEAVRQARQIVGANYAKLVECYAATPPDLDGIQLWQVRWEKSIEALRKQERDDRDAQKSRGQLVSRAAVETEIAQMLEALRLMHGAMTPKIIASLNTHAAGRLRRILRLLEKPLKLAIETVRGKEVEVLRNMQSLTSAEAAAAAASVETLTLAA